MTVGSDAERRVAVSLYVTPAQRDALKLIATERQLAMADVTREAIREYLAADATRRGPQQHLAA